MSYSKSFTDKLNAGHCMVRKIWLNTNSTKGQYSVQFMQTIENENSSSTGEVVSLFQGFDNKQRVTAIISVSPEVIKSKGVLPKIQETEGNFYNNEKSYTVQEMFGEEFDLEIQVTENFEKNPFSTKQEPKVNPSSGEILTKDGKPIYRHTMMVMKGKAVHTFVAHDREDVVDTSTQGVSVNEMLEQQ